LRFPAIEVKNGRLYPPNAACYTRIAAKAGQKRQHLRGGKKNMKLSEKLDTPIIDEYDVIVAGSGPAGSAAALTAARAGAKTLLLESNGCLGGVWTAGLLTWLFEMSQPGFVQEINAELIKRNARRGMKGERYSYEAEEMKLLLEEMCQAAGVEFLLHTRVTKAYTDERRRVRTIVAESKSGRQAWHGKAFIDATGDGDLGALAGCDFDYGQEITGKTQPMTHMALISVKDHEKLREFISFYEPMEDISSRGLGDLVTEPLADWGKRHQWRKFKQELERAGLVSSYGGPTLFQVRDNVLALMINHAYGVSSIDAKSVTEASVQARSEINRTVKALRSLGGPWEGVTLAATAEHIGVREGRRIHGRYTVTKQDLMEGKRHEDGVARVHFNVDIHTLSKEQGKADSGVYVTKVQPYDIPLRALIAQDVDGLMLAGRCISGDFTAHASYRVTGVAATLGQAAGATAALSALSGRLPHQVDWIEVKEKIEQLYMSFGGALFGRTQYENR
jgi:hypothetical protein